MRNDRDIEKAIEAGKKNQRAKELVENWCSHARVVKFGGTGLIEAQTGLPIGHHSIECNHAEAPGVATWLIADAALDFHDRNCVGCTHRAPVRLPNLTQLLKARDERRERRQVEEQRRVREAADALAARHESRQAVRSQLDAVGVTVIDHIETVDRDGSDNAREALLNTARLAPEVFTPPLIEHCFALLEARERWFDETGLKLLQELRSDPARLTHCALLCLGEHSSVAMAAAIVEANSRHADEALIDAALPALVLLALPPHTPLMSEPRQPVPGPLLAVHRAHPKPIEAAIEKCFRRGEVSALQAACRAIIVLSEQDQLIAARFVRSVAAKLARSDRLQDEEAFSDGLDDVVYDMRRALAQGIRQAPDETDALILNFLEGARGQGQAHLYSAYREVLRVDWRKREPVTLTRAHTVAIKRLLSAAMTTQEKEVTRELQSAFGSSPGELVALARQEIEGLLGAALLLDDRLNAQEAPSKIVAADALATLEKWGQRNLVYSLQTRFIRWAAEAAAGDREATKRYMALLAGVPAERDSVRAALLEGASPLMSTPDGLAIVLPTLYSAMVGTSNRMRAAGAALIEDIAYQRKDDLPELVLEALVMQLSDPYVIVHRAAVQALDGIKLPKALASKVMLALWTLIQVYSEDRKADDFLLRCIRIFSNRYATEEQLKGNAGRYLISLMHKMEPYVVSRDIGFLERSLKLNDAFALLLLHLSKDPKASEYDEERIFDALSKLPPSAVRANIAAFEATAMAVLDRQHLAFIELLTRAGAWEEAARVAEGAYAKLPDTNWHRPRRLAANLDRIAASFERSIAAGDVQALQGLATEWRVTCAEIEQDRAKNEERRNPLTGLLGSD